MSLSLGPHASMASDITRTLERALMESRSHWNDSTRMRFDQRYAEPLVAHGRRLGRALTACEIELSLALRDVEQAEREMPATNW